MASSEVFQSIKESDEPIKPLPEQQSLDPKLVALGRKLFFDTALSKDNSVSCATCHDLNRGGTDRLTHSIGINKTEGPINAPTVLNSMYSFIQFWDGRATTLEEQAAGPIQNPKEMGSTLDEVIVKLKNDPSYAQDFQSIFGSDPTPQAITSAIATFERTLTTPNSPFDRFLRGDKTALAPEAEHGYKLFKMYGCISCHQGRNVGGNMFQKLGIMGDYFVDRGNITQADLGRYNVTHLESDRHVFKVPSLRNVELTAPYFHDGSAKTLQEAVRVMAKYQLGRSLSDEDTSLIIAFLKSLTGEQPK